MVINLKKYIAWAIILLSILFLAYSKLYNKDIVTIPRKSKEIEEPSGKNAKEAEEKNIKKIKITAVGDILLHEEQLKAQFNSQTKKYSFSNNFTHVKPYIQDSDLAIANLETSLTRNESNCSGYPVFRSPIAITDALMDAGFNIIAAANNHILDGGKEGFFTTNEVLKEKAIDYMGIKKDSKDESFIIKEVKGIKVGIANYTFENSSSKKYKAINSVKVDKNIENLIDTFNNNFLEDSLEQMKQRVKLMKDKGAELIVFYIHWGEEYKREPDKYQKELAQKLSDIGVDIILGSHPHVIQPMEFIKSQSGGKETLVVYSMGNFISNQRYEILKQRYSEDGIIVNITVAKDMNSNNISIGEVSYISTWVNKYEEDNKYVYEIIPIQDGLKDKEKYNLTTEEVVWRAENSEKNTELIISKGSDKVINAASIK